MSIEASADPAPAAELRLDDDYQATLPEFYQRRDALTPADVPQAFSGLFATA